MRYIVALCSVFVTLSTACLRNELLMERGYNLVENPPDISPTIKHLLYDIVVRPTGHK